MTTEIKETTQALALPDETTFRRDLEAINKFQQIVHANMIKDQDYGVIPGTSKPTLLKPGAEKIAKLLGLADEYTILEKREDWDKGFFSYIVRCNLINIKTGITISQGLGECNSMESKYRYRWVGERDLPAGIDKTGLVNQERRPKAGGKWRVYRLDNDDIYSQVNTLLKMAKKRGLVDAALSAGRLSNIFTQDIEDIPNVSQEVEAEVIKDTKPSLSPDALGSTRKPSEQAIKDNLPETKINLADIKTKLADAGWKTGQVLSWLRSKANFVGLDFSGSLSDILGGMDEAQLKFFLDELDDRISMV